MNDRYLFRGKRVDNSEWVKGDLVNHRCGKKSICVNPSKLGYRAVQGWDTEVIPETVGQCTDEKVFNTCLFDGDKLSFTVFDSMGGDEQYKGEIRWCYGEYMIYVDDNTYFNLYWVLQQDDEVEITGNIHEEAI